MKKLHVLLTIAVAFLLLNRLRHRKVRRRHRKHNEHHLRPTGCQLGYPAGWLCDSA